MSALHPTSPTRCGRWPAAGRCCSPATTTACWPGCATTRPPPSPRPGSAEVLGRLAAVDGVTVALVSGRGVADLQATSGLSGPFRWVGSHGAEFDGPLAGELAGRRDDLAARAGAAGRRGTDGARLEVKPASVAVHVRQVADRAAAAALLERAHARRQIRH